MKAKDTRVLVIDQTLKKEKQHKEELFNLRLQQATGQLENTVHSRQIRRNVARVRTILSRKELSKS